MSRVLEPDAPLYYTLPELRSTQVYEPQPAKAGRDLLYRGWFLNDSGTPTRSKQWAIGPDRWVSAFDVIQTDDDHLYLILDDNSSVELRGEYSSPREGQTASMPSCRTYRFGHLVGVTVYQASLAVIVDRWLKKPIMWPSDEVLMTKRLVKALDDGAFDPDSRLVLTYDNQNGKHGDYEFALIDGFYQISLKGVTLGHVLAEGNEGLKMTVRICAALEAARFNLKSSSPRRVTDKWDELSDRSQALSDKIDRINAKFVAPRVGR